MLPGSPQLLDETIKTKSQYSYDHCGFYAQDKEIRFKDIKLTVNPNHGKMEKQETRHRRGNQSQEAVLYFHCALHQWLILFNPSRLRPIF